MPGRRRQIEENGSSEESGEDEDEQNEDMAPSDDEEDSPQDVFVAEQGDRFEVPKSVFSAAATASEYRRGVVVSEARGGTNIWFENDTTSSWYKGTLSDLGGILYTGC